MGKFSKKISDLINNGVTISDIAKTEEIFLIKNYFYFIDFYKSIIPSNAKDLINQCTLLYNFDRDLSTLIHEALYDFENKLQSIIAFNISEYLDSNPISCNNPYSYMEISNYDTTNPHNFNKFISNKLYPNPNDCLMIFKKYEHYFNYLICSFKGNTVQNISDITLTGTFLLSRFNFECYGEIKIPNGTVINNNSINLNGIIMTEINYSDHMKFNNNFIKSYTCPPLAVIIKNFHINDLLILLSGTPSVVFTNILSDFNYNTTQITEFKNSLEIIKELRNHCAHQNKMISFETSGMNKISPFLSSKLNLNNSMKKYRIKLWDVLKVLGQFVDVKKITDAINDFLANNSNISAKLANQIGK